MGVHVTHIYIIYITIDFMHRDVFLLPTEVPGAFSVCEI